MTAVVADTHAALWYLLPNSRLAARAADFGAPPIDRGGRTPASDLQTAW